MLVRIQWSKNAYAQKFSSDVNWNWFIYSKFIKRVEISVNIWNVTKWIDISIFIQIVRIEINVIIQNTV